jgi:hypothetical protein
MSDRPLSEDLDAAAYLVGDLQGDYIDREEMLKFAVRAATLEQKRDRLIAAIQAVHDTTLVIPATSSMSLDQRKVLEMFAILEEGRR